MSSEYRCDACGKVFGPFGGQVSYHFGPFMGAGVQTRDLCKACHHRTGQAEWAEFNRIVAERTGPRVTLWSRLRQWWSLLP